MGEATRGETVCSGCGQGLPLDHLGPCPQCGDPHKTHRIAINSTVGFAGSLGLLHVHTYYEKHPIVLAVLIVVTVGSPFIGLALTGWTGVAVGLVISALTFIIGFCAVTKVRSTHAQSV